jgi:hypothetical protein
MLGLDPLACCVQNPPVMQWKHAFWPTLAHGLFALAVFSGCSGQSPLSLKITNPLQDDERNVLLAGRGCEEECAAQSGGRRPSTRTTPGTSTPAPMPVAGYGGTTPGASTPPRMPVAGYGGTGGFPDVGWAGGARSVPSRRAICGDGLVESPEQCEPLDLNGATCGSLGYFGGLLQCNVTSCNFDTLNCFVTGRDAGPPVPVIDAGLDDDAGIAGP